MIEKYYFLDDIENIENFISSNLLSNDIITCFNYKSLYSIGNDGGHVSLIADCNNGVVTLFDVYEEKRIENTGICREVLLDDLIKAIDKHGKSNRAGFWVVESKDRRNKN